MAVRGERSSGRKPRPPPSTTFNTRAFRLARPAPRAAKEHDVHAGLGHNVRQLLRTRGHRPGSSIRSPPSHAHNAGRDRRDREPACRAGAEGERRRQKDQCHFCERSWDILYACKHTDLPKSSRPRGIGQLVPEPAVVLGEDRREQRARLEVQVVLRERIALRDLRGLRPREGVRRDLRALAHGAREALHELTEVALEVLEAQDVIARVLHVHPLRQPMAVGHGRAVDARARRAQGLGGKQRKLVLEARDRLVRAAEHGVDVCVEGVGGAALGRIGRDEGGGRGLGLQLEGELADGALHRVAHDAKGLLQRVDAAALATRAEGRERQVPRRARLPRAEAAERAVRVRVPRPLGLLRAPARAVSGADLLHGRAARLGDVDELQHVVQRRHLPPPFGELLAIDLSARLLVVQLVLNQLQTRLAALERLGRPADVEVGAAHLAAGAHAHEAERRHADAQPLEGAQVVAHLALGARAEALAGDAHDVELVEERLHHSVARAVGEAVVHALPVLEVGHAQPEVALGGAPQQRRGEARVRPRHDHVGVLEAQLALALLDQVGHAAHAEAGAHDVEADLGVRDGRQPDARHLGGAIVVERSLGDLVQAIVVVRLVLVVSVGDAWLDELVVLGAQLDALLAAHARDAVELLHEHGVHEDVQCAIGRLQQRREEVLLDARERERRAALRAVEGHGDARLLALARDAARANVAHDGLGAAVLRVEHDLGARRRPEHALKAGAQLRKRDVVHALREVLVHHVVVHLAVPGRHSPLAGLAPRALGGAAARLLGLPVLLRLVGVVRDVCDVRRR
eukprot:scaffold9199_cov61-Phaeocystis_antarctica.AAC.5